MHALVASRQENLSEADDERLVDLVRQGDESAVRVLVQRYNRRLYRVARAVLRNDAEAEDVVQEAQMNAFASLDRFRGESSFSTWITRIALNAALGRARRSRKTVGLEAIEQNSEAGRVIIFPSAQSIPNPEQAMARLQVRELLEHAVEDLPEPFRIVLILRDIEDMSIDETALHLGIKQATVKTRLHRARNLMREILAQKMAATLPDLFPFAGPRCERVADQVVEMLRQRRTGSQ
jgi:RNA polymerase sigma-70 factor, ECF subfamily